MIKNKIRFILLTSIFSTQFSLNAFSMEDDIQEMNRRENNMQIKFREYEQRIQSLEQERNNADKLVDHITQVIRTISNPNIVLPPSFSITDDILYTNTYPNPMGTAKNKEMEDFFIQSQERYQRNRQRITPIIHGPQNLRPDNNMTLLLPMGKNSQQTKENTFAMNVDDEDHKKNKALKWKEIKEIENRINSLNSELKKTDDLSESRIIEYEINELEERKEHLTDSVSPLTSDDEEDQQEGKIVQGQLTNKIQPQQTREITNPPVERDIDGNAIDPEGWGDPLMTGRGGFARDRDEFYDTNENGKKDWQSLIEKLRDN